MQKIVLVISILLLLFAAACQSNVTPASESSEPPEGTITESGSGAAGGASESPERLTAVSGSVREVKDGLVLISLADGNEDYMLRFSENSRWEEGVDKDIQTGNVLTCLVKLEPTLTTPSQGEVIKVISNQAGVS